MLRTVIIIALATVSSAQISGLSNQCLGALSGIVADPDASCLKANDLIPLANSSGNTSIVPIVDTWTKDICSVAPCSNATLANVVKTIVTGCQVEIITGGKQGEDPNTITSSITPIVQRLYPTVRNVMCLKHGDTLCDTEILQIIQTALRQNITLNDFLNFIIKGGLDFKDSGSIPNDLVCLDCIKAAYTVVSKDFPDFNSDDAQEICGASFADGTIPSTISNSAADASPSPSGSPNGASTLLSSGFKVLGLTVIFTFNWY